MDNLKNLKVWLYTISRGYTLPMSLMPCIIAFLYAYKLQGDVLYGVLALIGTVAAHLGTNVFDDFVDYISKVPKQKCKTEYLDNKFTTIKGVLIFALFYFMIASAIGLYLTIRCGWEVILFALFGGLICLFYPKLNHRCLGEIALATAFGPLLFGGFSFVMLGYVNLKMLFLSLPVTVFITVLLVAHALMDYDFDLKSGKKTLCVMLGSKKVALNGIFTLIGLGYFLTILLLIFKILPWTAALTFLTIPAAIKLYKSLSVYINTQDEKEKDFMLNFKLTRNISVVYNLIIIAALAFMN